MDQTTEYETTDRKGRCAVSCGTKWAVLWVAVALIAAPAIGRFIAKQGR